MIYYIYVPQRIVGVGVGGGAYCICFDGDPVSICIAKCLHSVSWTNG